MPAEPSAVVSAVLSGSAKGIVSSLAWGIAPGIQSSTNAALKARFSVSIPDIPLVEIDPVSAEQLAVFLSQCASPMVFSYSLMYCSTGSN